eukprot:1390988-Pyramimonas_sp.AAC.1
MDQSDPGSVGIFSRWTDQTQGTFLPKRTAEWCGPAGRARLRGRLLYRGVVLHSAYRVMRRLAGWWS